MTWRILPHSLVLLLAAFIAAGVAGMVWKRRHKDGGWPLLGLMAATFIWTLAAAVEASVTEVSTKILWSRIEYFGFAPTALFFLLFSLHYTGQREWFTFRRLLLVCIIPIITPVMAWTNGLHEWLWSGFSLGSARANVLIYHHGPWFWVFAAYSYILTLAGFVVLLAAFLNSGSHIRAQLATILLGALLPLISGILYMFDLGPIRGLDIAPLGFAATGLLAAWGLLRLGLLDLVPVGRAALIESMPDGMVVLDEQNRIADMNPAARRLLSLNGEYFVGRPVESILEGHPGLSEIFSSESDARKDVEISGDRPLYLNVRISSLPGCHGLPQGRIVILRDITERKLATLERERMLQQLQQALGQVKTLRGLLPICSTCKKIRDDKGSWRRIESYIRDHSEAKFSHSICPDCLNRLYPGVRPEALQEKISKQE